MEELVVKAQQQTLSPSFPVVIPFFTTPYPFIIDNHVREFCDGAPVLCRCCQMLRVYKINLQIACLRLKLLIISKVSVGQLEHLLYILDAWRRCHPLFVFLKVTVCIHLAYKDGALVNRLFAAVICGLAINKLLPHIHIL